MDNAGIFSISSIAAKVSQSPKESFTCLLLLNSANSSFGFASSGESSVGAVSSSTRASSGLIYSGGVSSSRICLTSVSYCSAASDGVSGLDKAMPSTFFGADIPFM